MGAGRVGRYLAELLVKRKHELAIIEKDKDKAQELSKETDALVINGDGTQQKTFQEVSPNKADFLVAVTGKDEINLLSCLVAKDMGVHNVIARVTNPIYRDVFKKLGIDFVISPEITAAMYIEKLIMHPGVADLAILGREDVEILEFVVTANSHIFGRAVGDIQPNGFLFIAIYKNGELVIPTGKTIINKGDRVIVLVKTEAVKEVEKLFV